MKHLPAFTELAGMGEDEAREYFEQIRWPNGVACPHCGGLAPYKLKAKKDSKTSVRPGVWKCKECRKQFTVTVGTVFAGSRIPLKKWLMAVSLLCSSKKGMSAHQLHRMLGITYKTAWFMAHRIRCSMARHPKARKLKGVIEADEAYIGGRAKGKTGRGARNKTPVLALIERGGEARVSIQKKVTGINLRGEIKKQVDQNSIIITDGWKSYNHLNLYFPGHRRVNHGKKEYARGQVHVNTAENFFSILKRGIVGVYHHVGEQHLHRYLDEFTFRYNTRGLSDAERVRWAVFGGEGKRLRYKN